MPVRWRPARKESDDGFAQVSEIDREVSGTDIVIARIADMLLVEAIRAYSASVEQVEIG